jgi:hypothetical protein
MLTGFFRLMKGTGGAICTVTKNGRKIVGKINGA